MRRKSQREGQFILIIVRAILLTCFFNSFKDPPRESPGGHALSVPHLMRAVYGDRTVKIIAVLREPTARLHAAFHNYEHYGKHFGAGADGKFLFLF